ncbi:MAG: rubrerythrin family protein [Firmicutes bacterium]|nr:rubrerythrin family protein [Bacillota bacterium]
MAELKGSKTAQNLMAAFAGESQANMRYTLAAKQAKKDGYVQISMIFEETARNEREHAAQFYKFLPECYATGEGIAFDAQYPVVWSSTEENLQGAIDGEREEADDMYVEMAKVADEEGFSEIAEQYRQIAKVEDKHAIRFQKLLDNIKGDRVFKRDEVVLWKCNECGYIAKGQEAPKKCPSCHHPQAYFELFKETY